MRRHHVVRDATVNLYSAIGRWFIAECRMAECAPLIGVLLQGSKKADRVIDSVYSERWLARVAVYAAHVNAQRLRAFVGMNDTETRRLADNRADSIFKDVVGSE